MSTKPSLHVGGTPFLLVLKGILSRNIGTLFCLDFFWRVQPLNKRRFAHVWVSLRYMLGSDVKNVDLKDITGGGLTGNGLLPRRALVGKWVSERFRLRGSQEWVGL